MLRDCVRNIYRIALKLALSKFVVRRNAKLREGPMAFPEKRAPEVDHVNNVSKILPVHLKPHVPPFRLIHIHACGCTCLEGRGDTASRKVNPADNLLADSAGRLRTQ